MGESQSRYSIVERLLEKKLSLMSKMDSLTYNAKISQQRVETLKKNIQVDKDAIKTTKENEIAELNRRIDNIKIELKNLLTKVDRDITYAEIDAKNALDNVSLQKESLQKQIEAIDSALLKLEEISKSALV